MNVALQREISQTPNREKGANVGIGAASWIGDNVTIVGASIGIGAVVGAGSIVTREVAPFSIVAGNPARLIRMRYSQLLQDAVLKSRWWDLDINELRSIPDIFGGSLSELEEDDVILELGNISARSKSC